MKDQKQFLAQIIHTLHKANIPYMISGSVGSSFHGQPRATNDADIVIAPTVEQIISFIELLGPDFYVSKEAAKQAIENKTMFNIIDIQAGYKTDLIVRKQRPFSQQEFTRRTPVDFFGIETWFVTPEDSILSKLEWSKDRRSETQFNDALGVLMAQKDNLDYEYLKKWAKELGVDDALQNLLKEANL